MYVKNNTIIYVEWASNSKRDCEHDLCCCLLPRCEALRTCRSVFPIATEAPIEKITWGERKAARWNQQRRLPGGRWRLQDETNKGDDLGEMKAAKWNQQRCLPVGEMKAARRNQQRRIEPYCGDNWLC